MNVVNLSDSEKIAEAMRRSLPHLPAGAAAVVKTLLQPETLAIIATTLLVWAGSHLVGVGQVVDIILLTVGAVTLGFAVFEGAGALYDFAVGSTSAKTEQELDKAGADFARAVTLLGISTIQAVLLRGQGGAVIARGRPQIQPRLNVGSPPAAGNQLRVSRPMGAGSSGTLGVTDAYGAITIARNQTLTEQRLTLLHELVHRYFSPRMGPLRKLRAELNMAGYMRSSFLRYLEEALAEGYAQLRIRGLKAALGAYRFPLQGGYVTVSELLTEGYAVGTIVLGGTVYRVSISVSPMAPVR